MTAINLQETYTTKNGSRETPLQITGETHTISTSKVKYGGVDVKYIELDERPSSAAGYRPTISGYNESESISPGVDEFYIDFRTARLYFASTDSGSVAVDYYGYGTVIRNEHINTIQTDLNKLQLRAMVGVNNVKWSVGTNNTGSVTFNATTDTIDIPAGTIYLPPSFDGLDNSVNHGVISSSFFESMDVIYCPIEYGGSVTLAKCTFTEYCALTAANLILAMRINDVCYLVNGVTLIDGEAWTPSTGSGGGALQGVYKVSISGDPGITSFPITHGLGSQYVLCQVYNDSAQQITPDQITLTGANTLTITLSSFGTITGYNVVVVG